MDVGGQRLRFAKAVIATGARAATPPIEGLEDIGCLTNETLARMATLRVERSPGRVIGNEHQMDESGAGYDQNSKTVRG